MQVLDEDGNPLSGGKVYTYEAGTLTPLATYADYNQVAMNTNPIILDAAGEASVWWSTSLYKVVVADANDVVLQTVDDFGVPSSGSSGGGSGGGFGAATEIASATTVDLGSVSSHLAVVTGTTPTTSFGSSASIDAPIYRIRVQSPGWSITLGANILCPFITSTYTSLQNDYLDLEYLGSGSWKIFAIYRGDGSADFTNIYFSGDQFNNARP
jgi:hypothetical protein